MGTSTEVFLEEPIADAPARKSRKNNLRRRVIAVAAGTAAALTLGSILELTGAANIAGLPFERKSAFDKAVPDGQVDVDTQGACKDKTVELKNGDAFVMDSGPENLTYDYGATFRNYPNQTAIVQQSSGNYIQFFEGPTRRYAIHLPFIALDPQEPTIPAEEFQLAVGDSKLLYAYSPHTSITLRNIGNTSLVTVDCNYVQPPIINSNRTGSVAVSGNVTSGNATVGDVTFNVSN